MKHKTLWLFIVSLVFCIAIYNKFSKDKLYYVALGDDLASGITPFNTYGKSYTDYLKKYLKDKELLTKYIPYFSQENYGIKDLYEDIINNKEITIKKERYTINNEISKASLITISIGQKEMNEILKYKETTIYYKIDLLYEKINELLIALRKITDCPIIFIGYYDTNDRDSKIFEYIKNKFKGNSVYYVDIYEGFKNKLNYLPNPNYMYPSLEGYNYISNKIIDTLIEKNIDL